MDILRNPSCDILLSVLSIIPRLTNGIYSKGAFNGAGEGEGKG
jgi:hypothetical protein